MQHNVDSCDWIGTPEGYVCARCRRIVNRPVVTRCGARRPCRLDLPPRTWRLGDWIARGLQILGVRKTPRCGCAERQRELNQLLTPTSLARLMRPAP